MIPGANLATKALVPNSAYQGWCRVIIGKIMILLHDIYLFHTIECHIPVTSLLSLTSVLKQAVRNVIIGVKSIRTLNPF